MASEWKKIKVGYLADSISETHALNKEELVFLNTSDIYEGRVLNNSYSQVRAFPGQAKKSIKKNDILLSEIRPANKRYAFIDFISNDYVVSTKLMVIRAKGEVLPKYLYYFLISRETTLWLQHLAESRSGTFPQITFDQIAELDINLPPREIQKKVISIMENLDDKIELNRQMNETLEAIARAIFKSWFVNFDPVIDNALRAENPIPNALAEKAARWRELLSRASAEGRGLPQPLADLFPARFEDSKLGRIPKGWGIKKVGDCVVRHTVGKKYDQKTVVPRGKVPVLDQGKSGIIGYHNDEAGVFASLDEPKAIFANHTCYMRLITFPFSAIQNVLPFTGRNIDTIWIYYATYGIQPFLEYKGHWPDFVVNEIVVPPANLTKMYGKHVKPLIARCKQGDQESASLAALRDTLLPKLISGKLRVLHTVRPIGRYI